MKHTWWKRGIQYRSLAGVAERERDLFNPRMMEDDLEGFSVRERAGDV